MNVNLKRERNYEPRVQIKKIRPEKHCIWYKSNKLVVNTEMWKARYVKKITDKWSLQFDIMFFPSKYDTFNI